MMPARLQVAPTAAEPDSPPESAARIRVLLADNHAAMRRSLYALLAGEDDIQVVAVAPDISIAMRRLHHHQPDVLVLDLGMHNGSSIDVIHHLHQQAVGGPRIVVLTMEDTAAFARRAIHAGAIGFVVKDRADSELPDAIRAAACGREYVSKSVRAGLDASPRRLATADLRSSPGSGSGRAPSPTRPA